MSQPTVLRLAVCLFPNGVAALDFTGPMELFAFLAPEFQATGFFPSSPIHIHADYLCVSKEPVRATIGTKIIPDNSYPEVTEQYDILLVPGGSSFLSLEKLLLKAFFRYWHRA